MNFALLSGGAGDPVERFVGALSLSCLPVAAEWIVGRGESGQCAELPGSGAKGAGNAAEQIFDLLFSGRNSLEFNGCDGLLDTIAGAAGGGRAGFDQGGRGSRAARALGPYNPSAAAKFVPIAQGPKIGLEKRGGARAAFHNNTAHDQDHEQTTLPAMRAHLNH